MRIYPRFCLGGTLPLLLGSCMVGPDYYRPAVDLPEHYHEQAAIQPAAAPMEWWKSFADPTLDDLIARAVKGNTDLKIAEARIREARAARRVTASALFPQLSARGQAETLDLGIKSGQFESGSQGNGNSTNTLSKLSDPIDIYQANLDASWEIDLFGGTRRQVEAARAVIGERQADLRTARLTLIGDVAENYIEWIAAKRRIDLQNSLAAAQQELVSLADQKYTAGIGSQFEVSQAATLQKATLAELPTLEATRDAAGFRLSVLLGEAAGPLNDALKENKTFPAPIAIPALAAPAATIAHRPDVEAAERALAAATALHGAAIAELYPKISLSSLFGVIDTSLSDPTRMWSITGGVSVPLLTFGRIEGGIAQADARQAQAYQAYRGTVLSALGDIETALSAVAAANRRVVALEDSADSAAETLHLARERYDNGLSPFTDVLDAQSAHDNAEIDRVSGDEALLRALIRLHKALGLGA